MDNEPVSSITSRLASLSRTLFEKQLTLNHKIIISSITTGKTLSSLTREISGKTGISEPTVRRTLRMLRNLGFIETGTRNDTGKPVQITEFGKIMLRGHSIIAVHRAPESKPPAGFDASSGHRLRRNSEAGMQFPLTPLVYKKEMNKGEVMKNDRPVFFKAARGL